jgi:hypothetical protein
VTRTSWFNDPRKEMSTMTITLTRTEAEHRNSIRNQIGQKTPEEIRALIVERYDFTPEHLAWLSNVADRLALSGYVTLADVTDDEFDDIVAE